MQAAYLLAFHTHREFSLARARGDALVPSSYHRGHACALRLYFGIVDRSGQGREAFAAKLPSDERSGDLEEAVAVSRLHDEVPLNGFLAACSCPDLPGRFVQSVCQPLIEQDTSSSSRFEVSWVELLAMVLVVGGVGFPARRPTTTSGDWKDKQSLPFAPPMTFPVHLRLVKSAWQRSLGVFLLERLLVQGLDRCGIGVLFALHNLTAASKNCSRVLGDPM